jgi:predicted XRE-type DNA-binding protein
MNRHKETREFFLQVAYDYLAQLEEVIEAKRMGRSKVAKILGVTKGRVSQILNHPSNLGLESVVKYARRLNRKVAVVLYDDGDGRNRMGPILPQIFIECWKRQGSPRNFFDLNKPFAPPRLVSWNRQLPADVYQLPERVEFGQETANTGMTSLGIPVLANAR